MKIKDRILHWLSQLVVQPEVIPYTYTLSRRCPRHEFTILQVQSNYVCKVQKAGKVVLLDLSDWRSFKHDLANFCQAQGVWASDLTEGKVHIHCLGMQEYLPRGIRYTWRFNKL